MTYFLDDFTFGYSSSAPIMRMWSREWIQALGLSPSLLFPRSELIRFQSAFPSLIPFHFRARGSLRFAMPSLQTLKKTNSARAVRIQFQATERAWNATVTADSIQFRSVGGCPHPLVSRAGHPTRPTRGCPTSAQCRGRRGIRRRPPPHLHGWTARHIQKTSEQHHIVQDSIDAEIISQEEAIMTEQT
jgi:hypothetical protein